MQDTPNGDGGRKQPATEVNSLLLSVAEQLKMPLTVIARQAELSQLARDASLLDASTVHTQATAALQLVDSYMLGLQLAREQAELELEPVSIASTLVETAHSLERFAGQYGVHVELLIAGKHGPVMANARGLRAALLSLGFALAEAMGAHETPKHRHLTLAAHRTPHGIIAGIYGGDPLTAADWRTALNLCGRAQQPLTGFTAGSGAGIFVADAILRSMQTRLRVGRYGHQAGLAATFQPSQQLQFV